MGKNIFVSYKYLDTKVQDLNIYENVQDFLGNLRRQKITTTVRHYVNKIDELFEAGDHIFKGEDDGEDMSTLKDSTIGSKLGDKIFYSSVTIVLISKGMKEIYTAENDQWIPWEISYSLKEQSRDGGRSNTNAVLAVVIPDEMGQYDYYITDNPHCNSRTLNTNFLFQILKDNMFNRKNKEENIRNCNGIKIYEGFPSYIYSVKWSNFIANYNKFIEIAISIRENITQYDLTKTVK